MQDTGMTIIDAFGHNDEDAKTAREDRSFVGLTG